MIIKGEILRWDTCHGPTELRWFACLTELIWTQKSKSNMLTPKTNSQTCWPKVNFIRDEWNHLLRLFNIMNLSMFSCSHFLSIKNSKTMSKRSMQDRKLGEEPVLAKSNPVSLVSKRMSVNQSPCRIRASHTTWRIVECQVGMQISQSPRNRGEIGMNAQPPRNRSEKYRTDSQGQGWHTTVQRSVTDRIWRTSSRMYRRRWNVRKTTRCWILRSMR